jgi:acyl carrier protein
VEKSELDVLQGIAEEDWARIKQIIIEVHNKDGRLAVICEMLEKHGYKLTVEQGEALEKTGLYNVYGVHWTRASAPAIAQNGKRSSTGLSRKKIKDGKKPAPEDLRNFLAERLPATMVPTAFVILDKLPLTPNGKLDLRALPPPPSQSFDNEAGYVAPRNEVEEKLAGIWAEVLGKDLIGVHDNYFDLGGHSLLATLVAARIRAAFNVELSLQRLFEATTVAQVSELITNIKPSSEVSAAYRKDTSLHAT